MSDTKYNPASDSTPAMAKASERDGRVHLDWSGDPAPCLCGCKGKATGRFQPGHDARLKGKLLRAHLADVEFHISDGKTTANVPAIRLAEVVSTSKHDWKAALLTGAETAKKRLADAAKRKEEAAKKAAERKANAPATKKVSVADFATVTEQVAGETTPKEKVAASA